MRALGWIAELRRTTTSGDWIPEIDGLRFIAIASVLLFHMQNQLSHHYTLVLVPPFTWVARIFGNGNRGVPLFFVISGFILARPFAQHHLFARPAPSLRRYFFRRLTRLEPPYLINLIAVSIGTALADHRPWASILPHLAASAAYLHYFIFGAPSDINSVAWSLEVEVQFYILAPLLCSVFAIRNAGLRRFLIVAAMIALPTAQSALGLSAFTLLGELQYFLAGLVLADLYLTSMARWKSSWRWDVVSLIGWPALFLLDGRFSGLWLPFLTLLLYIAALRGVAVYAVLRNPWIAVTGGACYTIYLWHAPVLTLVGRTLGKFAVFVPSNYALLFVLQGSIKTLVVAAVCLPLFVLIERPCMNPDWPQIFKRRLRQTLGRFAHRTGSAKIETTDHTP